MSVFPGRSRPSQRIALPEALAIGAVAGAFAIATGFAASRSPAIAATAVGVFLLSVGAALGGLKFILTGSLAALPWMVVFNDLLPPDVKTFTSAAAALSACAYVLPIRPRTSLTSWGVFLFLGSVLSAAAVATSGAQFIQAAKYMIFPFMALAVTSRSARGRLPKLVTPVLVSAALAMVAQLIMIATGLGAVGTYYHVGENLGFDAHDPLELALMGVIIACGGLAASKRTVMKFLFLAVGLIPAIETGDRSALVASALVILIFVISSRFSFSHLAVIGAVAAVIIGSGVLVTAETRITNDVHSGEFASLATAGSGRGEIWAVALRHYVVSGPTGIVLGTGLRSIPRFEQQALGGAFVGHSDVLEVGVQLGLLGFAGWILIWIALLTDASLSRIVLTPIAVYAAITGSIEATAPLATGLFFAAAAPSVAFSELLPIRRGRPPGAGAPHATGQR